MTQRPQPNFDRVARIYRWAEYLALGPMLLHTREHFLPLLNASHRALVLGDGDGRFLAKLLRQNPTIEALAVDTSARMLQLLRRRCSFAGDRLQTEQANALTTPTPPQTDLIVTHFFLDCLSEAEVITLAHRLAHEVEPGALWLVSDFGLPHSPLLRPIAAAYIRSLYFAFRVLTGLRITHLPNPQSALASAGFSRLARHQHWFGLLYTELWRLKPIAPRE
ncbi:MAG: class I SAM-dependent methyltransferase [Acidobacteriota bacterium]